MKVNDQLFVRACKCSGDTYKRLKSIYRRFWMLSGNAAVVDSVIASNLMRICEQTNISSLSDFREYDYRNSRYNGEYASKSLDQKIIEYCTYKIRITKADAFPGLTPPLWWRIRFGNA